MARGWARSGVGDAAHESVAAEVYPLVKTGGLADVVAQG